MTLKGLLQNRTLLDDYEARAQKEPMFGIALALFELAAAQREVAEALDRLGFNEFRPKGAPGIGEKLVMEFQDLRRAIEEKSQ